MLFDNDKKIDIKNILIGRKIKKNGRNTYKTNFPIITDVNFLEKYVNIGGEKVQSIIIVTNDFDIELHGITDFSSEKDGEILDVYMKNIDNTCLTLKVGYYR